MNGLNENCIFAIFFDLQKVAKMSIEVYVTKCKPIPVIYKIKEVDGVRQRECKWKFLFKLKSNSPLFSKDFESVKAEGSVMNVVIGFDAETYDKVSFVFPELVQFFINFFEKSKFNVNFIGKEIVDMTLPDGNCLTFLKWLSVQENFDYLRFCETAFSLTDDDIDTDAE